jgi:hypothetical protein
MGDWASRNREQAKMAEEQRRRQWEIRENFLWWQRFWAFFDQQRDEAQRAQREAIQRESARHGQVPFGETANLAAAGSAATMSSTEAVEQTRDKQAELVRMATEPLSRDHLERLQELSGLPLESGEYSSGHMRKIFLETMLALINEETKKDDRYPLKFLVNPDTEHWRSTQKYSHDPSVNAGHVVSRHSEMEERFAIEDAMYNQWSADKGESGRNATDRATFFKEAILIGGVPVERRTAMEWESAGLLPKGTVDAASESPGWRLTEWRQEAKTKATSLREAMEDYNTRVQRQVETKESWLWWQRFYAFFDQQRDELYRRQQEDNNLSVASTLIDQAGAEVYQPEHPLHWLINIPEERRDGALRERLARLDDKLRLTIDEQQA